MPHASAEEATVVVGGEFSWKEAVVLMPRPLVTPEEFRDITVKLAQSLSDKALGKGNAAGNFISEIIGRLVYKKINRKLASLEQRETRTKQKLPKHKTRTKQKHSTRPPIECGNGVRYYPPSKDSKK